MVDAIMQEIRAEAEHAAGKYGPPVSTHEALGVLMEEFDELKQAIHDNHHKGIEHEAIQVAAVAYSLAMACARGDFAFMYRSGLRPVLRQKEA